MKELFQEVVGWLGYLERGPVVAQLLVMLMAVTSLSFVQRRWPVSGITLWVRRWVQILALGSLGFGLGVLDYPFRLILVLVVLLIGWYGLDGLNYFFIKSQDRDELCRLDTQVIRPFYLIFCLLALLRSLDSPGDLALIPVGHWFGSKINIGDLLMALSVGYLALVATGPLAKLLARLIQHLLLSDEGSMKATALIIRYLLMAAGLLWSVHRLGVNSTALVAVASGLSLGIGFGIKEIAADFISGIWILLEGSVRPGAKLFFDGEACEVKYQNLRATILWRESDNAELLIPNITFLTNTLITYASNNPYRRCEVMVPVSAEQKPNEIMALMEKSAASIDGVLRNPAPQALLTTIGDISTKVASIYAVRFMINDPINQPQIASAVYAAIWQILSANDLASLKASPLPLSPDPPKLPSDRPSNSSQTEHQLQASLQANQGSGTVAGPHATKAPPGSGEQELVEKLRRIEELFVQTGSMAEERVAAEQAQERIQIGGTAPTGSSNRSELRFTLADQWSRHLFVALMRRYGIHPYRYRGQRCSTVMARLNRSFVNDTLWPEFQELQSTLAAYFDDLTDRVIEQAMEVEAGEAEEYHQPAIQRPPQEHQSSLL
jgi:small-conductance mechanosensitive channel